MYAPVFSLERHARTFQVSDIDVSSGESGSAVFEEYAEFVKQNRFNVIPVSSETDLLRYQVSSSQLTKMLGLPNGCIQQMVDDGVIKPCNSTNVLRDQLFDLREVSNLVAGKFQPGFSGRVVTPKSKELTTHLTTYGKLLSDILSGSLNGLILDNEDLNRVIVFDDEYSSWLLLMLEEACKEAVPVYKARAAIQCSEGKLREMVIQGQLKYCRSSFHGDQLDGGSFYKYFTEVRGAS